MRKAIGYARLSQKDRDLPQEELETSIINQENEIRQYCKKHEFKLIDIYREKYITGDDPDRPKFNELLEDVKNKKFDVLVVRSLSRITREGSEAQEDYILYFGYHGVEVVSMTEDTKNELTRFIYGFINRIPIILGRISTRQMREGKKALGMAYFRAPFGYKNLKKQKNYWKLTKESEVVLEVFDRKLAKEDFKKTISELKINVSLYYKILGNRNYVGVRLADGTFNSIISHNKYVKDSKKKIIDVIKDEYLGHHPALISPENWLRIHPGDKDNVMINLIKP